MSEGPVNLNWGPIMKHINEDPHEFFLQGGWEFLGGPEGAQNDGSSGESDTESEFEESEAFEESESASESDFSDDASASDSGSYSGSDISDEGDDWDELERKAAKCEYSCNLRGTWSADNFCSGQEASRKRAGLGRRQAKEEGSQWRWCKEKGARQWQGQRQGQALTCLRYRPTSLVPYSRILFGCDIAI